MSMPLATELVATRHERKNGCKFTVIRKSAPVAAQVSGDILSHNQYAQIFSLALFNALCPG